LLRDEGALEDAEERDGTVFVSDGGDEDGDAEDGDRRETGDLDAVVAMSRNNVPATDDVCRDRPQRNPVRVPSDGEHDALCSLTASNLD
jgi:hypothetical protein